MTETEWLPYANALTNDPITAAFRIAPIGNVPSLSNPMMRVDAEDEHRRLLIKEIRNGKLATHNHAHIPLTGTAAEMPSARISIDEFARYAYGLNIEIAQTMSDGERQAWAAKDTWTTRETAFLLCGRIPELSAANFQELNNRRDDIERGIRVGTLRVVGETSSAERLYDGRHLRPAEVIAWAGDRFPKFALRGIFPTGNTGRWPWGTYETKLLLVLADAVRNFWTTWEPGLNPTPNDQVVQWLRTIHGLSENQADSIATIIRADNAPTGRPKSARNA